MAVRGGIGPPLGAFVDDRADFVLAVLVHPDWIGRRRDATRAHDLDAVCALPQLVARRVDARVYAVVHAACPVYVAAGTLLMLLRLLLVGPTIAMPATQR